MGNRRRRLAFTVVAFAAAVLALAAAAVAARAPLRRLKVPSAAEAEKVVAYGHSRVLLLDASFGVREGGITRLRLDGSVDRSFGDDGTVQITARDAVVAADGKLVVAAGGGSGSHAKDARIVRLLPDGKLDCSFGTAQAKKAVKPVLASGGRATAKVDLRVTDAAGNAAVKHLAVKLTSAAPR